MGLFLMHIHSGGVGFFGANKYNPIF